MASWVGGPMYYIKNGLAKHWRWLAAIYALFGVLTVFGTGKRHAGQHHYHRH